MSLPVPVVDGAVVYVVRDVREQVLYVGSSVNVWQRFQHHRHFAPWYSRAARVEVEGFPTIEDARIRERDLIAWQNPPFNVQCRSDLPRADTVTIHAPVPSELREQIERIAERDERSVSWVVRRALRDYAQNFGDAEPTRGAVA